MLKTHNFSKTAYDPHSVKNNFLSWIDFVTLNEYKSESFRKKEKTPILMHWTLGIWPRRHVFGTWPSFFYPYTTS
jgi:hypothetical protein